MSPRRSSLIAALSGAGLLVCASSAFAEFYIREYQEPRWMTMRFDRIYTGVYAEAYSQTTTVAGGAESKQERLFFGPLLGLDLSGSVYHPNLVAYRINVDGSLGWAQDSFSGTAQRTSTELRFLGSFLGEVNFLDSKPFHGRLFSSYNHSYQDYDFFNRIYVDTWRYGGGLNYTTGPFSIFTTLSHETTDATGNPIPIWSESTIAVASITHQRKSGSSTLSGSLNDYTRTDFGVGSVGQDYNLNASDAEDFGSRKNWHSVVNLGYNHLESMTVPTHLYTGTVNLRAEHSDRLSSQYSANYSRNTYGNSDNENLSGNVMVEHKLFDSLTTDLTLQGYRYTASSDSAEQKSWQLGGGPGFRYTKRLSSTSSLSAYENIGYFHTDVQSSGGLIPVVDEQYFFGTSSGNEFITLRQPNVVGSSIVVTYQDPLLPGRSTAILGVDYEVIVNGQFTIIQKLPLSHIQSAVWVSYNFLSSPSGSYDTLNNACGLRFNFFNDHLSAYTRYTISRNSGAANLVVQDLNIFVLGAEGHWRALRAGAEYELYDSSLSPYNALRFFEALTFAPEERSTLTFNFTQSFISYQSAGRNDQNYTATINYNRALTRRMGFNIETGVSQRIGEGNDQTLAICRPQLQYAAGKFSASIGYDLNYDEYLNSQTRIRNLGFIRLRKEF